MSRVKLEIDDELDFDLEDGDMIIHIKHDGEIGKVCMPDMDYKVKESLGYKKMEGEQSYVLEQIISQ